MSSEAGVLEKSLIGLAEHIGLDAQALLETRELKINSLPIGFVLEKGSENLPVIQVFCSPGALPQEGADNALRALLRANAYWADTRGASFGIQQDCTTLILAQRVSAASGADVLARAVRNLVQVAQDWQANLGLQP